MENSDLPLCKYGKKCYRKSAAHLQAFSHSFASKTKMAVEEDVPLTPTEQNRKRHKALSPSASKTTSSIPAKQNKITDHFLAKHLPKHGVAFNSQKIETKEKLDEQSGNKSPTCKPNDARAVAKRQKNYSKKEAHSLPADMSSDVKLLIEDKFSLQIPSDFYLLWKFCYTRCQDDPRDALMNVFGLKLVGPYDFLTEEFKEESLIGSPHLHWRYFYDPPEMITVIAEINEDTSGERRPTASGFHMGYFRDDPQSVPDFVAWNYAGQDGTLMAKGENLFASLCIYGEHLIRQKREDAIDVALVRQTLADLKEFLRNEGVELCLDVTSKKMKARQKKVVCKTFHGVGLVVPVVNDVGYRPVPVSAGELKRMVSKIASATNESEKLSAMDPLQELVTLCQFANDEGDFGEAIELGLDLFTSGSKAIHSTISHLLPLAYELVGRPKFADIIKEHLANRRSLSENIDLLKEDDHEKGF